MKGRVTYLAVLAVLVVVAAGAAIALRPSSETPDMDFVNPGKFTGVAGPGSFYEYLGPDGSQNPGTLVDAGRPSCADEQDNDLDGLIDADDPECDGDLDANERLDGVQPYTPTTLSVKIKANGVMTLLPGEVRIQPVEKCAPVGPNGAVWCLLVAPRGAGPAQRGRVDEDAVTLPLPLTVKFDAAVGYPGLDPRCEIGYTEHLYRSEMYDPATGVVVFETGDESEAPALDNCGEWTDLLNAGVGLPALGHSRLVVTIRNDLGEHPQFR